MQRRSPTLVGLLWVLALLLLPGCGGKTPPRSAKDVSGAKVQVRIAMNGQPFKPLPNESLQVHFFEDGKPPDDRIQTMVEMTNPTETATLPGPTNKGIPPGKYRVAVASVVYGDDKDRFEAKFSTEATKMVADVGSEDGQTFVIDVGRGTVKKQ